MGSRGQKRGTSNGQRPLVPNLTTRVRVWDDVTPHLDARAWGAKRVSVMKKLVTILGAALLLSFATLALAQDDGAAPDNLDVPNDWGAPAGDEGDEAPLDEEAPPAPAVAGGEEPEGQGDVLAAPPDDDGVKPYPGQLPAEEGRHAPEGFGEFAERERAAAAETDGEGEVKEGDAESPEAAAANVEMASLDESEMLARIRVKVGAGTRWQVERPLEEHKLFLVLSPPPRALAAQIAAYQGLSNMEVAVERQTETLAVIRIEQRERGRGPILVHVGQGSPRGAKASPRDVALYDEPGGVAPSALTLEVIMGRLSRHSPRRSLCAVLRTPMDVPVPEDTPDLETLKKGEALFLEGRDEEAADVLREIARPIRDTTLIQASRGSRVVTVPEVAALRLTDIQVCRGRLRSATLRYELIMRAKSSAQVRALAGLKWVQLTWPDVPESYLATLMDALPRNEDDALEARMVLHGLRVLHLTGAHGEALERLGKLEARHLGWLPESQRRDFEASLVTAMVLAAKQRGDDVRLASVASAYKEHFMAHPRARAISVEVAGALRRLGLPDDAVVWLQESMEGIRGADEDVLLLAELALAYRESGDVYRAERTIRYLVERLRRADGWLGRRQELTIAEAAISVALDARRWKTALGWVDRARSVGAGPTIVALGHYLEAQRLREAGSHVEAADAIIRAAKMRRFITPFRRVEVCLQASQLASSQAQLVQTVDLLRRFMAEVETDDEEVEVGYALADVLARSGDRARAMALLEDIALKQPEGTYGRLAKHALTQLAFERRAEALIGGESPRRP